MVALQMRTALSTPPVAIRFPSGDHDTQYAAPAWPRKVRAVRMPSGNSVSSGWPNGRASSAMGRRSPRGAIQLPNIGSVSVGAPSVARNGPSTHGCARGGLVAACEGVSAGPSFRGAGRGTTSGARATGLRATGQARPDRGVVALEEMLRCAQHDIAGQVACSPVYHPYTAPRPASPAASRRPWGLSVAACQARPGGRPRLRERAPRDHGVVGYRTRFHTRSALSRHREYHAAGCLRARDGSSVTAMQHSHGQKRSGSCNRASCPYARTKIAAAASSAAPASRTWRQQ